MEGSLGPFCQSCGMPLATAEDFGTDATGRRINDYCRFCYEAGRFTDPHMSESDMIERCATIMATRGVMAEGPARTLMSDVIPRLKRWRP